ncbi:c-type cytochrome [Roseibacillus persicicus]|uniref:c-type cytochrome n=1 Tax=Roseibacillus persicicus TaxID=454148 RepID=UPI00280EEDDD|nr:c-type cytochrome [Roseibacillus persicicus]MDQ8189346.1 c-type cytochrome [Roseibacillus persicicus]
MAIRKILLFSLIGSFSPLTFGMEGKAEYEMFCGACHNPDGKGAGEGAFPPLAGSEWVKGDPERMIQVVLHGLEGPVSVSGKSYNLAMPPQGGVLSNEQIAAIVSYVRGSWGNKEKGVDAQFVKKARERTASQQKMWKANQLLDKWPLPSQKGPVEHLIATVYKGEFKSMPDFSKLEPSAVEEEAEGYFDLSNLGEKDHFAVVWEGEFNVENGGDYTFQLDSDDGARLFVNGEKVTEVKGIGAMGRTREGRVLLEPGVSKIRLEYFEYKGEEGIALGMRKGKQWVYFTKDKTKKSSAPPSIPLVVKDEARIYRNFIKGTTARAIGVGYPGGVNLAFSADELGLGLAWTGDFIDAGLHWTGRGQGFQSPGGRRVLGFGVGPAFALSAGELSQWPKAWQNELKPRFRGYVLDDKRQPEFRYEVAGIQFFDKPEAVQGRELVRNIKLLAGDSPPQDIRMRLSAGGAKSLGSHSFELGNGVRLEVAKCDSVQTKVTNDGVILELKLKPGENRIGLRYVWK